MDWSITKTFIDIKPGTAPVRINASMYDNNSRLIVMTVKDGGRVFDMTGLSARVEGTRADGTGFMSACTIGDGTVSFLITKEMTNSAGDQKAEIVLFAPDNHRIGSANFIICVEPAALDEDTEISPEDETLINQYITSLTEKIDEAMNLIETAEQAASNAESAMSQAAQSASSASGYAISARNSAEAAESASSQAAQSASAAHTDAEAAASSSSQAAQYASAAHTDAEAAASASSQAAQYASAAHTDAEAAASASSQAAQSASAAHTDAEAAASASSQAAQSASAAAASAEEAAEMLANKADVDGVYPDLYAGNLTTDKVQTNKTPYLFRPTAGGLSRIGDRCYPAIIGASVAENQLINVMSSDVSKTESGITITDNRDGSYTVSGTATELVYLSLASIQVISGHKYFWRGTPKGGSLTTYRSYITGNVVGNADYGDGAIFSASSTGRSYVVAVYINSGATVNNIKFVPQLTDLTAEFGSSIADYIYSLEQAMAGSGIAWLRSYDLITDEYKPYNTGTIESVEATAKVVRDENGENAVTYPLGSDVLRGIFKLDANNKLYADGDRKEADGTITRYYGTRAYQEGDESLADAITDGTTTVYKLSTPTTETSTPFTSPQLVYPDGTEEFVTETGVPVGHETKYPYNLKGLVEGLIDVPDVPSANGTYILRATRTSTGVSYVWTSV